MLAKFREDIYKQRGTENHFIIQQQEAGYAYDATPRNRFHTLKNAKHER